MTLWLFGALQSCSLAKQQKSAQSTQLCELGLSLKLGHLGKSCKIITCKDDYRYKKKLILLERLRIN